PRGLILSTGAQRWAFALEAVLGEFELIRKPCDPLLVACLGFAASAMLDDGRLVLYLNPAELVQRAQSSTSSTSSYPPPVRSRRVLVVDDSVMIRQLLSLVLGAAGYSVTTADDGRHGLAVCEQGLPDLILCDLDMPEMGGMEMLQKVRARWPKLPVIIFSNHSSPELQQRAQALGVSEYVVKAEYNKESLLHAVERVLGPAGERPA
ncbi:MAG TPA: response regulator, partial [Pseudomonadota bacterium]|nr:response regulator [Pseudomonadota bacterium]